MRRPSKILAKHSSICHRQVAEELGRFANPTRLAILLRLLDRPHYVDEIVEAIGAKQANVSKQLGILKQGGLVKVARNGNRMIYSIDGSYVELVVGIGIKLYRGIVTRKIVDLGWK